MLEDDFVLVSYRKPFKIKSRKSKHRELFDDDSDIDCDSIHGTLVELDNEIKSSPFGESLFAKLKESLATLKVDAFTQILCYGLGKFSRSRPPKYQLALLKYLKEQYNARAYIYDPNFSPKEIEMLEEFGFQVISSNEEGKRTVNDKATLVFLPHCPHFLTNNLLYANWSRDLCNCVVIGNSISSVVTNSKSKEIADSFLARIMPVMVETVILNDSMIPIKKHEFLRAFNSTSIHIFPQHNLNALPDEFWANREEPDYKLNDEMITAKETKGLLSRGDVTSTSS